MSFLSQTLSFLKDFALAAPKSWNVLPQIFNIQDSAPSHVTFTEKFPLIILVKIDPS